MSFLGEGVVRWPEGQEPTILVADVPHHVPAHVMPGKNLLLKQIPIGFSTCILCGGHLNDQSDTNDEHPLPGWLLRDTNTSNQTIPDLELENSSILRKDFSFKSHKFCNSEFGELLESKVKKDLNKILDGGSLAVAQLDRLLDWLDKLRTTIHISIMQAEGILHEFSVAHHHFPNRRVGLHDRLAFFFRVKKDNEHSNLQFAIPQHIGFKSTPSCLVIRIKDLVVVSVSDHLLLSKTFGLPRIYNNKGEIIFTKGSGRIANKLLERETRLWFAKAIYQPMRCKHPYVMDAKYRRSLDLNGQGKIFTSFNSKIERIKSDSLSFSDLPTLEFTEGMLLSCLEFFETIIDLKNRDIRSKDPNAYFMRSISLLENDRKEALERIKAEIKLRFSIFGNKSNFFESR